MQIKRKNAMKLWYRHFGNRDYAEDFAGGLMYREAYGNPDYYEFRGGQRIYCGWSIHHILPKACGGTDAMDNLACTNIITNELAEDKVSFWIDGHLYQVQKIRFSKSHQIVLIR